MKVAIMQPYFFPYLGYFALIKYSDQFIVFDTPQFIRHGWIERNRILNINNEPLYIKVPLIKHKRETNINEIQIKTSEKWQEKILAQLMVYKKRAPYYTEIIKLIQEILDHDINNIVDLNFYSLQRVCSYLQIETPIVIWSRLNVKIDEVLEPDEWALNICKAINAKTYYNSIGGSSFFNSQKYVNAGIELKFMKIDTETYPQFSNVFVPFLSIIDVLMFNDINVVNNMLDNHTLVN